MQNRKINLLFFTILFELLSLVFVFGAFSQVQHDIAITATVPPRESDFQFAFTSTDGLTSVSQDTTLSYQITYGANSSAGVNTNTVLVADFSSDLAPDSSHILDYVIGSASNAYANTPPVIDLINRTITWTIPALPAGVTNQTVNFQLRTNSNYTEPSSVNFTTRAKMSNQYQTLPDQTINQTYRFGTDTTATSTPASNPTSTPKPSTTPTPTLIANPLKITGVEFTNISKSQASINVGTNRPAKLTVAFGKTPANLFQKVNTNQFSNLNNITLENLSLNTTYYFQITAFDASSNTVTSEIFTFHTARDSTPFNLENAAATIVSGGNTIFSKVIDKNYTPGFAILTDNTDYEFSYAPSLSTSNLSFEIIIRNKNSNINTQIVKLLQKNSLLYLANLKTSVPGMYEMYLKAQDDKGNLLERKIADLKVTPRLSVYELGKNNPISDARVFIYYYNSRNQKYEPINKELFGNINNPQFTDADGNVNIILPSGKYRVSTSAFWHNQTETNFTLGPKEDEVFPQIYLERNTFNLTSLLTNLKYYLIDLFSKLTQMSKSLSSSARFFNLFVVTTSIFSGFSLLFFLLKTHIKFKNLPIFFIFHMHVILNKHKQKYIYGIVTANDKPVTKALIELLDKNSGNILTHVMSNKAGHFQIRNIYYSDSYKILVEKEGYQPTACTFGEAELLSSGLKITLKVGNSKLHPTFGVKFLEHIGESLFESALFISIFTEILFMSLFGIYKTLPFLALSCFNILLWIFYLNEHNDLK